MSNFDGTAWSFPPARPEIGEYSAVWGATRGDVWAAGASGVLAHRTGGVWVSKRLEERFTTNRLNDIWGLGPNDIWMVGNAGTVLRRRK
jgi:hypothetical protein